MGIIGIMGIMGFPLPYPSHHSHASHHSHRFPPWPSICNPRSTMQTCEWMEAGIAIASQGRRWLWENRPPSPSGLEKFWRLSLGRLAIWRQSLSAAAWPATEAVIEEIFAADVLTRVWIAVACEAAHRSNDEQSPRLMHNVLSGHFDIRRRAMQNMVAAQDEQPQAIVRLNRLRRRGERWTDLLLALLLPDCEIEPLAHDAARSRAFAAEHFSADPATEDDQETIGPRTRCDLLLASLQSAFRESLSTNLPNAPLNTEIAASALASLPAESVTAVAWLDRVWLERLTQTADDTLRRIAVLL